jgi:PAS domain S-box-containing protein
MNKNDQRTNAALLRARAEEALNKKTSKTGKNLSEAELLKFVHELEVHQIELEIQNEELMMVKEQAESALFRYTELYDFAPSGYFTLSKEGKIIELNLVGSKMLGKFRSHLIKSSLGFFVSADTRPIFHSFIDRVFTGKKKEQCEVTFSAGEDAPTFVRLAGIVSQNGEYCFLTAADITEQKQSLEALRGSEEHYRTVVQSATDAIIVSNSLGIIHEWNRGAEKIFGYTEKEIIGRALTEILPERYIEQHTRGLSRMAQGGESRVIGKTAELSGLHKNGNEFPIELSLSEWGTSAGKYFTAIVRDISERRRSEAHARESEKKHSAILETAMDGFWLSDMQGRLREVNETYCRMSGYSKEELLSMSVADIEAAESSDDTAMHIRTVMMKGEDRFKSRHRRKDGTVFHVEVSVQYKQIEDGRMISFLRDITENIRSEEIQRESVQIYKTLADSGHTLVWTSGRDKLCNYFNRVWLEFTGRTLEQETGNGWMEGVHQDDVERCMKIYSAAFDTLEDFSMEYRLRRHDGEYRWIVDNGTARYNSSGEFIGYIGHCYDITERKRAEEALRISEYQYRHLIETMPDGVYKSTHEGRFIEINPAMVKILGYDSKEELMALDIKTQLYFDEGDRESVTLDEELNERSVYRLRKKDGSEVWVEDQGRLVVDDDKNILYHEGVLRDITEQRNSEQALRQAQKLESIGTLAGGIAHDFNNLMNAVLGQSGLALHKLPKESPAVDHIEKAIKASERVADLTKQLLAYSGRGKFFINEIDLNVLLKENIQMLELSIPKTIKLKIEPGFPPPHIMGDVSQVQQVIMNLIINAGEAMGQNPGSIILRTGRIEIQKETKEYSKYTAAALPAGSYAMVQVRDTGSGISPATLSRIFDPFFTTKFTGRGLGLAAVLGIIKGHKGGLRIESEEGKGTMFEIVFPLVTSSRKTGVSKEKELPAVNGEGKTILVIDDESSVIELLKDVFTEANFNVIGASEPLEGINIYRREFQSIVLVVLDYSMPHMDGKLAFEELRKINNDVKVILCSGYSEEETLSSFGIDRPTGFFQKPFTTEKLVKRVAEILADGR